MPVDFAIVGSGAAGGVIRPRAFASRIFSRVFEQGQAPDAGQLRARRAQVLVHGGHHQRSDEESADVPRRSSDRSERVSSDLHYIRAHGRRHERSLHRELLALHEVDFNERSRARAIAGTGFADWPIDYAELEPYYTKVDWEIGVSGLAGASPFDPPRTKPYPMPPLPMKSSGVLFERGARKLGLHPFPAPMAINSEHYRGRPAAFTAAFATASAAKLRRRRRADDDHSGSRSNRPLRSPRRKLRRSASTPTSAVVRPACITSIATTRAVPEGESRHRVRERRGNAAAVVDVGERAISAWARELERPGRQVSDVQLLRRARALCSSAQLNEYKSVQVTRILHDFYDSDPKRGFYGGGGIDCAHRPAADRHGRERIADEGASLGPRVQTESHRVPAHDEHQRTRHVTAAGDEQRLARSRAER